MAETQPIPPTSPTSQGSATGGATRASSSTPSFKPNLEAGETTIDDKLAFEVELACYEQLQGLTGEIKRRIEDRLVKAIAAPLHVFFLDNALRSALDIAATIEIQLTNLKEAYAGAALTASGALAALRAETPAI
jgi:hypothetical protein